MSEKSKTTYRDRCCNPFGKPNHKKTDSLRKPSNEMVKIFNIQSDEVLCSTCRKELTEKIQDNVYQNLKCKLNNWILLTQIYNALVIIYFHL